MLNDFKQALETLTNQNINSTPTEIGCLLFVNITLVIHFIELNKLTKNLDLPSWKVTNNAEQTVSVFENEWIEKPTVVLSRIKSKLGLCNKIYARKTTVVKLNRSEAYEFLNHNHTNIPLKNKYNFGLMYNNEIVALASFGPIMHKKTEGKGEQSGELIRFCNKLDCTVVGGLSKLLNHFINQHQVDDVMTYIDKDWSDGKSFIQLGFEVVGERKPFPFYYHPQQKQFVVEPMQNELLIFKSGLMKMIKKINK